jgi:ribosomal-protein-alanine N-acetyltransferase
VVEFAFTRLGLHRIEAACVPENEASHRLLLKAGFEAEGRARAYLKIDGRWRDHLLFGMVND